MNSERTQVRDEAERAERAAVASRNVRLGWCPCGGVLSTRCECSGGFRLAVRRGLLDDEPEYEREEEMGE